mgnify:CR=1 FL=1
MAARQKLTRAREIYRKYAYGNSNLGELLDNTFIESPRRKSVLSPLLKAAIDKQLLEERLARAETEKRLLEELFTSGASTSDFPFVRPPSASPDDVHLESRRGKLAASSGAVAASGRRVIVFMLGGVTQSETRAISEVAKASGRDIIVGATDILSPKAYLMGLKQLKKMEGLM